MEGRGAGAPDFRPPGGNPNDDRCQCRKKDGTRCNLKASRHPGQDQRYCSRYHQNCVDNYFTGPTAQAAGNQPIGAVPTGTRTKHVKATGGTVPFGQVMAQPGFFQPIQPPPQPQQPQLPPSSLNTAHEAQGNFPPVARPNNRGDVRTGQLPVRRGKWPDIKGFARINVTTAFSGWSRFLSPMLIGPFEVAEPLAPNDYYPDGVHPGFTPREVNGVMVQVATVQNIENYWQGSKIYAIDVINGVLQRSFFERRAELFYEVKGKRRALPKTSGLPISSYYGQIMSYVESRVKIYCPLYAWLVQELESYRRLNMVVGAGTNVLLLDFDSRDVGVITEEVMEREVLREDVPFGHAMVLACLLLGFEPWRTVLRNGGN